MKLDTEAILTTNSEDDDNLEILREDEIGHDDELDDVYSDDEEDDYEEEE